METSKKIRRIYAESVLHGKALAANILEGNRVPACYNEGSDDMLSITALLIASGTDIGIVPGLLAMAYTLGYEAAMAEGQQSIGDETA